MTSNRRRFSLTVAIYIVFAMSLIFFNLELVQGSAFTVTSARLQIDSTLSAGQVFSVKLKSVPNSQDVKPGQSSNFTIVSRNTETVSFDLTGYILKVEPPQSDIYSKYTFPLGSGDPTVFPAMSTTNYTYVAKAGPTTQLGRYKFIFYWTGTENGAVLRTQQCNFSLIVV